MRRLFLYTGSCGIIQDCFCYGKRNGIFHGYRREYMKWMLSRMYLAAIQAQTEGSEKAFWRETFPAHEIKVRE